MAEGTSCRPQPPQDPPAASRPLSTAGPPPRLPADTGGGKRLARPPGRGGRRRGKPGANSACDRRRYAAPPPSFRAGMKVETYVRGGFGAAAQVSLSRPPGTAQPCPPLTAHSLPPPPPPPSSPFPALPGLVLPLSFPLPSGSARPRGRLRWLGRGFSPGKEPGRGGNGPPSPSAVSSLVC